jgi:hypothetical protein
MGSVDDGYVCSSKTMKRAWKRRPEDFKRRILYYHGSLDRALLLKKELEWLSLIKVEELSKRYYNVVRSASGWHSYEEMKKCFGSADHKKKISEASKKYWSDPANREAARHRRLGKKDSPETIAKRKKWWAENDDPRDMTAANKKAWANDDGSRSARQSELFSGENNISKREEVRAKQSASAKKRSSDPEWAARQGYLMREARIAKGQIKTAT